MADRILEVLSNQGWHITKEGYDLISESETKTDLKVITQLLLDADIKDYGKPVLASALTDSKLAKAVLQIQKIKNISAPKSNQDSQAAPRMLKLILTDGHTYCQAIEISGLPFLNHNKTAPGSKLLINNAVINSNYVLLEENSCAILGGKVPSMYEKWEISKSISKHNRAINDGEGPPPWVSFGQKIQSSNNNQPFKSLDNKAKSKESSEFDVQRQDAIAEASTGAIKKVFGGGIKQYSQMQNTNQLKERKPPNFREKVNDRKTKKDLKNDEKLQKPPEKVSLFEFLENKLPPNEEPPTQNINKTDDDFGFKAGNYKNNYNAEKPKYNQSRNTYPNQSINRYQQNNFNNYYQDPNTNYNYQQHRRNPHAMNIQANNTNQRNSQYKYPPPVQENNKFDEKKFNSLSNDFQQMSVFDQPTNRKPNPMDKVPIFVGSKCANERPNPIDKVPIFVGSKSANERPNPMDKVPIFVGSRSANERPNSMDKVPIFVGSKSNERPNPMDKVPIFVGSKSAHERGDRVSLNSEFASRSLRQHLNIKSDYQRKPEPPQIRENKNFEGQQHGQQNSHAAAAGQITWKVGDQCMAKYWEDNKFYKATVTALTDRTCVVQFNEYGNYEEILQTDCLPLRNDQQDINKSQSTTSMEFRRGGNRFYGNNKNFGKPRY